MESILYRYELNPTTWVYLSSIALVAFFFKFSRLLSVRNLDLLGLIALAPSLLLISEGRQGASDWWQISGYSLLLGISLFFLVRLLVDLAMTRRPLLEPNLSLGGMTCILFALAVFLGTAIMTKERTPSAREAIASTAAQGASSRAVGPSAGAPQPGQANSRLRYAFLDLFPEIPSSQFPWTNDEEARFDELTTRVLCVLGHLAVLCGLIYVGYRHFENLWTGVALAMLYLMLPYTQQMAGRPHHVVPAALLVWMVAMYRHPLSAGTLLGCSIGLIYYPVFLLPLWASFYSRRGLLRFLTGVAAATGAIALAAALFLPDRLGMFWGHYREMFRLTLENGDGLWSDPEYTYWRFPVSILFCCMAVSMAIWPARKNLGTLLSCSAAVMLATQFWYPSGGLLYVNWYLPLLLLTMFRPNLEHRIATATVVARGVRRRVELRSVKDTPA